MENKILKYWKAFAIILIALNITLIVFLLMRPPMGRPHFEKEGGGPAKFMIEKLKFNEQQEITFKKLREALHDSIEILDIEGRELRSNFFDGLKTDSIDKILANKIAANQLQKELLTYNHFVEVKKLCTPEQKLIFNDIIQEITSRMGGHPKEGPERREE